MIFNCTTQFVNKRILQRAYPSGGELHTGQKLVLLVRHPTCGSIYGWDGAASSEAGFEVLGVLSGGGPGWS